MKISIITVVFNRCDTISRAISSVQSQTYEDIEHVVIDGCSLDGTVDLIARSIRPKDIFISEPDVGIYDALNKGIRLSTGDVIAFLHSDDIYPHSKVIENIMSCMMTDQFDVIYGDAAFFSPSNIWRDLRYYKSRSFTKKMLSWGWMPAHPAIFIKKNIYDKYGFFKIDYKIAADYDYLCRIISDTSLKIKYIPDVLVRMQMGGVSTSSLKNTILLNAEVLRACRENAINTNLLKLLSKYPLKLLEKCNLIRFF